MCIPDFVCQDSTKFMPEAEIKFICGMESTEVIESCPPTYCAGETYERDGTTWHGCWCDVSTDAECRALFPGDVAHHQECTTPPPFVSQRLMHTNNSS